MVLMIIVRLEWEMDPLDEATSIEDVGVLLSMRKKSRRHAIIVGAEKGGRRF